MSTRLLAAGRPDSLHPLTCTRGLGDCPVAGKPLRAWQQRRLNHAREQAGAPGGRGASSVVMAGDAWCSSEALLGLFAADAPTVIAAPDGAPLAWTGDSDVPAANARILAHPAACFRIRYPWDLLRINEELVGGLTTGRCDGEIAPGVHVAGVLVLGEGSRLLPGVYVEGNAVVGRHCKIGPNCYLRGNTSVGDHCHIGQAVEVKNSILMDGVGMGHLSYCGDSIIGEETNFGAGTITANFRHDGCNHRSMVDGTLVDTGRRKLGAIVGDDVHTGIHTSIYPGRKIWPHCATRPGDVVQHDLLSRPSHER